MRLILAIVVLMVSTAAPAADRELPPLLSAYSGKLVYLDFWASWCAPCVQSFPWLNQMHAKYGDEVAVVGVNVDTDAAAARAFLARHPAAFQIVNDPKGSLAEHYRIDGMPSALIIAPDGQVLHQHSGFRNADRDEYESVIRKAVSTVVRVGASQS